MTKELDRDALREDLRKVLQKHLVGKPSSPAVVAYFAQVVEAYNNRQFASSISLPENVATTS